MNVPGVILAGGLATRMGGGDKSLVDLGGKPILRHVIDRLTPQASPVALNANGNPDRFSGWGFPVLPDSVEGYAGPLAGVLAGLDWASTLGADAIVTVAADTPFFPDDLVNRLDAARRSSGDPIALAASPDAGRKSGLGRHPTFGLWPVSLREDLRGALTDGLRKVVLWTDRHGCAIALFDPIGPDPFFNVNTPEDLSAARARLEAAQA